LNSAILADDLAFVLPQVDIHLVYRAGSVTRSGESVLSSVRTELVVVAFMRSSSSAVMPKTVRNSAELNGELMGGSSGSAAKATALNRVSARPVIGPPGSIRWPAAKGRPLVKT
jgi:hypothetical protein